MRLPSQTASKGKFPTGKIRGYEVRILKAYYPQQTLVIYMRCVSGVQALNIGVHSPAYGLVTGLGHKPCLVTRHTFHQKQMARAPGTAHDSRGSNMILFTNNTIKGVFG